MFKRIIGILLICPSILLASNFQSKRFFENNGGLIDHISPFLIPDKNASALQNITMDDRGQLSKRNGYTVVQSTFALDGNVTVNSTWAVVGGAYHIAASGNDYFSVVVGTDIFRIGNTFSGYSKITGSVSLTNSITNLAQATDLQDNTIYCNESDMPFYIGSTGNALVISTNTISAAKTCATYTTYLVLGNTTESGTAFPNRVRWSDPNNINSFPALNYIDVEPNDGDKIVTLIAYHESVYIFKHKTIYQMLVTGLDGPDAFIIRPIAHNIGCWAKNSIRVVPGVGVIFLAQNTVYLLNDSVSSQYSDSGLKPIGDPIQRTLDNVLRSQWTNAVAGVYPHKYQYWLAVSTAGTTNTEVLVYDYIQNNWTIYNNMNLSMISQAQDSTGQNVLITGGYNATAWKQDNGSTDNEYGIATAINGSYTTGNILLDSPEISKEFKYLYVFTVGDQLYNLNVQAAYDYISSYEFNQTVNVGSTGALYDTGIYDTDIYPASGYGWQRFELNREAKSIRLQFNNSTSGQIFGLIGWVIVYVPTDFKQ